MKNKTRGITLIALVVTIVVLLILAAVSISMLTGENGIIMQAQKAKEQTIIAKEKEQVNIAVSNIKADDKYTGDNTLNATKLQNELEKLNGKGTVEVTGESTLIVKFLDTQHTYPIETTANKLSDIAKVGDYVEYNITYDNEGHVTDGTIKDGLGTGWRVAYVDKENEIVRLIPEGIPLLETDAINVGNLLDNEVADEVKLMELNDIEKICEQSSLEYSGDIDGENYNRYYVNNDVLDIISIGASYRINTVGKDWYGATGNMCVESSNSNATIQYFTGAGPSMLTLGIRPVITLKKGIICKGGKGISSDVFRIY